MARTSRTVVWLVALPVAAGLVVTSIGVAEPYASPSDLPVPPFQGVIAGFAVVVLAVVVTSILDRQAWRQMGAAAGLPPDGIVQFSSDPPEGGGRLLAHPTLTGSIRGRDVRARTYQTSGSRSNQTRTYTVVETDLDTPVEWAGMIATADDREISHIPDVETEAENWLDVDGEFAVWGSLSEEQAREILTADVRDSLDLLGGGVIVGDVGQEILNQFAEAVPDDEDGIGAVAASSFLTMAGANEERGPSRRVSHKEAGLLLDPTALEARATAVAAVADAIERASMQ